MAEVWSVVLVLARLAVLGLGVLTTAISFRAYRRNGARYLRDASLGFAIMTVGVFVEGVLFQVAPLSLTQVHVVESVAIALGFVVLLRSFLQ
ncbi:MAG: hypothetical protein ACI8XM_001865 [Haloarculaceae archaeon]|jgi:hypothetical protein